MKKSDLKQISDLVDERLDLKFDEKLKNFATKDDLKQFATKDDLKQFATKDDLDLIVESIGINISQSFEEFEVKINKRFNNIDKELLKRPTREEIFDKWDSEILNMSYDIDSLKYLHKDEWCNLPNRATIKKSI